MRAKSEFPHDAVCPRYCIPLRYPSPARLFLNSTHAVLIAHDGPIFLALAYAGVT